MNEQVRPGNGNKQGVLIIGGGISGVTTALALARKNIAVTLAEREPALGGLAASFCCKASTICNKCFACVVDKRVREITSRDDISVLTQTELVDLQGSPGTYQATLRTAGRLQNKDIAAVVCAAGIEPYDAMEKGEYGYGQMKNVLTARDLEAMLRLRGSLFRPSDERLPETIAFFQCVGSRDQSIGNLYCSQVCCAYALRLIKVIRHTYPQTKITFYYMDVQPAGVNFAEFLRTCREDQGVRFIRSIPSKVYHVTRNESLRVKFADTKTGEIAEELFDMIVLSVGMKVKKEARGLAALLKLGFDEDGFIVQGDLQDSVFITGACTGPKDIERSIIQAEATAQKVYQYLLKSRYEVAAR